MGALRRALGEVRLARGSRAAGGAAADVEIYLPLLAQGLAIGVLTGILYVLVALGLTLIYGILHIVNFAHGEIYMLGAMAVFYLHVVGGLPLVPTLAAIVLLSVLLGARRGARGLPLPPRPVAAARGGLRRHLARDPVRGLDRLRHPGEERPLLPAGHRAVPRRAPAPRAPPRRRRRRRAGGRAVPARVPHQGGPRHAGHRGGRGDRPHARRQRQPRGLAQRGAGLRPRRRRGRLRGARLLAEPGHGARAHPDVVSHHHRGRPRAASPAPCSPGCSWACSSRSAPSSSGRRPPTASSSS